MGAKYQLYVQNPKHISFLFAFNSANGFILIFVLLENVKTGPKEMKEHIRKRKIMAVTLTGSLANFLLLVFKFVAGVLGHSSAMIADAVHSLSDFVTDVIVLLFINISSKPKDEGHDYGHGKYETLATTIIGIVLMCVGAGLFWDGANKVFGFYFGGEQLESPGKIALIAAIISILIKETLYRLTLYVGKKKIARLLSRMPGIIVRMLFLLSGRRWVLEEPSS